MVCRINACIFDLAWVVEGVVRCADMCPKMSSTDSLVTSGVQEGNYTNVGSTLPSYMHQNISGQSPADGYTLFSKVDTPFRNYIKPVNGKCSIINTANLSAIDAQINSAGNNFGVCRYNASGYTVRLMLAYFLLLIALWRSPIPLHVWNDGYTDTSVALCPHKLTVAHKMLIAR